MSWQIQPYTTVIHPVPVWATNAVDTSSSALCCHFGKGWIQRATEPTSAGTLGLEKAWRHQHWSLHTLLMWANNGAGHLSLSFQLLLGLAFGFREPQRLQLQGHWGSKRHEMEISTGCCQPQLDVAAPRRQHLTAVTGAWALIPPGVLVQNRWGNWLLWQRSLLGMKGYVLLVADLVLILALPGLREVLTSTGVFSSSSPVRLGPIWSPFSVSGLQYHCVVDI